MCEQPFEYGEDVEVTNWANGWPSKPMRKKFIAYVENHYEPYITIDDIHCRCDSWKHARRPRPDLKKGQPIIVWDKPEAKASTYFSHWGENGSVVSQCGMHWDNYTLLKNYDYDADISEGI